MDDSPRSKEVMDLLQTQLSEKRAAQALMAVRMEENIYTNKPIMVKAGTGVGKSFAYLVPAILSGKKVVISTGSISLQDQLITKDLPFLQEFLKTNFDITFTFSYLKGKGNYVCRAKVAELEEGDSALFDDMTLSDEIRKMLDWAETSATGDESEINWESPNRKQIWSAVSVADHECPGAMKCPFGDICAHEAAKQAAENSQVLVVNHHFYGIDISLGGKLLPEHEIVIFDESHMLDDVFSSIFSTILSPSRLRYTSKAIARVLSEKDTKAEQRFNDKIDELAVRISELPEGAVSLELLQTRGIARTVDHLARDLNDKRNTLRQIYNRLIKEDASFTALGKVLRAVSSTESRIEELAAFTPNYDDDHNIVDEDLRNAVRWTDKKELKMTPIQLGGYLRDRWELVTPAFCSASALPTHLNSLGFNKTTADFLSVKSPFPYLENSVLYVPSSLGPPPPNFDDNREYYLTMWSEIQKLVSASRGRALLLFSSKRICDESYAYFKNRLPYTLMCQGEYSNAELIRRFSDDESSCLFATRGMWQGIDVPGEACSLVVIDRLPFPYVGDPVIKKKKELYKDPFHDFDLPHVTSHLIQGVGRLIRSSTDRGVVAILDTRIVKKTYGRVIVKELPEMKLTTSYAVVEEFFKKPTVLTGVK